MVFIKTNEMSCVDVFLSLLSFFLWLLFTSFLFP